MMHYDLIPISSKLKIALVSIQLFQLSKAMVIALKSMVNELEFIDQSNGDIVFRGKHYYVNNFFDDLPLKRTAEMTEAMYSQIQLPPIKPSIVTIEIPSGLTKPELKQVRTAEVVKMIAQNRIARKAGKVEPHSESEITKLSFKTVYTPVDPITKYLLAVEDGRHRIVLSLYNDYPYVPIIVTDDIEIHFKDQLIFIQNI